MELKNANNLIKTIILFTCYIFYINVFSKIFGLIGIDNLNSMFIGDIIFLICIIISYKDNLKDCFKNFKNEYSTKKKFLIIIKWVLILTGINILTGIFAKIICSSITCGVDDNSLAVLELFDVSFVYSLFKTLIFAPIAEELLFKKSIRDVVKNDIAFIIISSSIYTTMNFMYASTDILFSELVKYFMFSVMLSLAYIKNKDNIIFIILIKFIYNLIPTLILITSLMAGVTI